MPSWTIRYSKSGVFPMPAFTKSTLYQTLETFRTMYIIKQIAWHQWRSEGGQLPPGAARRGAPKSCQRILKNLYIEKFLKNMKNTM